MNNNLSILTIINSYKISLILKYIFIKQIENLYDSDNKNIDEIMNLFNDIIDNYEKIYNYNNEDLIRELKLKEGQINEKRYKRIDKLDNDSKNIREMYRQLNIGNIFDNERLDFTDNTQDSGIDDNILDENDESYDYGDGDGNEEEMNM